ncbi:hypothetical protein [Stecheria intestinalis]|uniref:hypothetical protein n=1 Tax=Stecheria intestinalis TaxID=2606630 RepID=UPI0012B29AE7|nr:hypothetical protein [Stecheria intestinalis]
MTETETFLRCEHKYPMNRSLMKEFLEEAEMQLVFRISIRNTSCIPSITIRKIPE